MNWIRENKFLTAFFAILIIGIGVLGFLAYSAWGSFGEVSENYNKQAAELKRLQNLTPYPNEANLRKMQDQRDAYIAATTDLQKKLAAIEFPLQPISPTDFQDRLRASVSQMIDKAKNAGVKPPEKSFYLGFDNYQTSLPRPEAAAPLYRQLQAIEFALNQLIEDRVDAIVSLTRSTLPEEAATAAPQQGGPRPQQRTGGGNAPAKKLVDKNSFEVGFVADQSRFRKWLNDISSAKQQFYVVRLLTVKNESQKGPSRADSTTAAADPNTPAAQVPAAAGAASPAPNTLKFVEGTEKIDVVARVDIVSFNPPAAPAGK